MVHILHLRTTQLTLGGPWYVCICAYVMHNINFSPSPPIKKYPKRSTPRFLPYFIMCWCSLLYLTFDECLESLAGHLTLANRVDCVDLYSVASVLLQVLHLHTVGLLPLYHCHPHHLLSDVHHRGVVGSNWGVHNLKPTDYPSGCGR